MAVGWMIGVMVETPGERLPVRYFYAVGQADRARAEWAAVDRAISQGSVASSPVGGLEPVQALAELSGKKVELLGLKAGEVRDLGWKWPRRWLGPGG